MRTSNIFDDDEEGKFSNLFIFQSSKKVKIKILGGKIYGDLNDLVCPFIVDLATCAEKLAFKFLEPIGATVFSTQVGEIIDGHISPCSAVVCKVGIPIDALQLEQLFYVIDKFVSLIINFEQNARQNNLFLKQNPDLDVLTIEAATEFLLIHNGKKINPPIDFISDNHVRPLRGKFDSMPQVDDLEKVDEIELYGFYNGYKIHKQELYVLNEKGKMETIFFDPIKDMKPIEDLIPTRFQPKIFKVLIRGDGKNKISYKFKDAKTFTTPHNFHSGLF